MGKANPFRLPPKSIVRIPQEIGNEIDRLNREHKQRLGQFVQAIFDSDQRGRWVVVNRKTLKRGRYYYIRRAWTGGADEEPCFAVWLQDGWRIVWNTLGSAQHKGATVEVYEWEADLS